MIRNIDVIIYYEHKVRELDACMRLRFELEQLGLSVIIASIHWDRYLVMIKYRPKLIILPFFHQDKEFPAYHFRRLYKNIEVINLHQEQFYNNATKAIMIPQTDITKSVYHIAWSNNFANALMSAGIKDNLISITGNPRTDNYYLKLSDKLKKYEGKEIIFIPTSFSWYFVDSSYFFKIIKDPNVFSEQRRLTEESARSIFLIIRKIARIHKEKLFVLRPHPFDPIDKFESLLKEVDLKVPVEKNLIVNTEGNVYEWIKLSELIISWMSTVSLEATVFNKNNIILQPVKLPDSMQISFISKYDRIYKSFEDVNNLLTNKTLIESNNNIKNFASESIGCADGNVNKRIASFANNILKKSHFPKTKVRIDIYLVLLLKSIMIDFNKRILLKTRLISKTLKFYSAIIEDLNTVSELEKIYNDFKIKKL